MLLNVDPDVTLSLFDSFDSESELVSDSPSSNPEDEEDSNARGLALDSAPTFAGLEPFLKGMTCALERTSGREFVPECVSESKSEQTSSWQRTSHGPDPELVFFGIDSDTSEASLGM